ncbi:hypothetical protein [Frankia sp. KB5]|uniref:hypothetical protein n=1 Tax=Frankia sp. KB5 TaxID=683318 RepID=UPI001F53759A|nr:hypothetical protein [Frankia sp. KB5]
MWAIPSEATIVALDRGFRAGGGLFTAWVQARREDEEIRLARMATREFPGLGGLPPMPGRTVDATREVRPTDRRQLFEGMGGLTAAAVLAATSDVRDQLDGARPKSFTVTELELQLADLQRDLWSVAPAVLFPPAFEAWQQAEEMLNRRVLLPAARRLTLIAGNFSSRLATISRFGGDDRLGRRFADIAQEHATAAGDPLLTASLAQLQSWIAMDAGHWTVAADHAARGRQAGDPSAHARLAAYEAAAAAEAGDYVRASEAVSVMRSGMSAALKGPQVWGDAEEDLYLAMAAAATPGASQKAIHHGTRSAEEFRPGHDNQGIGLARIAVARGHLAGDHPAPDAAAVSGIAALDAVADSPNAVVEQRARALHRQLSPWPSEPLVQELGSRVAAV